MDLRVLVVCPDPDSAKLLSQVLGEMEMNAEQAPSISRGLERLNEESFEAVILDYRADLDSEEFLSKLRQNRKSLNTLLIAIVDGEFSARPLFGLGANFVLYRPLSLERTRLSLRAARALMRRERRRTARIPVNSSASVAYPGAEDLRATIVDLSDGGTSVRSGNTLPPACKVYFQFALPGQEQAVRLSGEVAWQDASGRTGIRFVDVRKLRAASCKHGFCKTVFARAKNRPAPPIAPMQRPDSETKASCENRNTECRSRFQSPWRTAFPVQTWSRTLPHGQQRAESMHAFRYQRRRMLCGDAIASRRAERRGNRGTH